MEDSAYSVSITISALGTTCALTVQMVAGELGNRVHHQDVPPAGGREQRLQLLHLPPPPQELPRRHLAAAHLHQPARQRPLRLRHGQVADHEDRHHQAQSGEEQSQCNGSLILGMVPKSEQSRH